MDLSYTESNLINVHLDDDTAFSKYCNEIGAKYCPYFITSGKHSVLFRYDLDLMHIGTIEAAQEELVLNSIILIEKLRLSRMKSTPKIGLLTCYNLCFVVNGVLQNEIEEIINWPHWILKCLYTEIGLMFGKFWIDEKLIGKLGDNISSPPINFLSIRSAIKPKDPYFLDDNKLIMKKMLQSYDKMQNVHKQFNIDFNESTKIDELRNIHYYQTLKKWSEKQISI